MSANSEIVKIGVRALDRNLKYSKMITAKEREIKRLKNENDRLFRLLADKNKMISDYDKTIQHAETIVTEFKAVYA